MQAEQLTAEFGIAGVLDFIDTEHGLVKAAISLGGVTGELYLQGAQVTAWEPASERDLGDPAWRGMICVETGNIADNEVRLAAGAEHQTPET